MTPEEELEQSIKNLVLHVENSEKVVAELQHKCAALANQVEELSKRRVITDDQLKKLQDATMRLSKLGSS